MADEIKKETSLEKKSGEEDVAEFKAVTKEDELANCQKERDEYLEGWKRAKADLANYKKDEIKRLESLAKFGQEALVRELIAVLDSFDLALVSEEAKVDSKTERGLYLIRQQLEDVLRKIGLERIIISVGDHFDPAREETLAEVESDKPSGTVVEEVERGYLLNGKLIRPARVKVSK